MVRQTDPGQKLDHAFVDLGARQLASEGEWQGDIVGDGLGRQQVEMLENHADLLAKAAQLGGIERGHFFTVDNDLAAGRLFQAVDQAQHGALAGPGVADQAKHLAILDRQGRRIQGGNFSTGNAVSFVYLLELDHVANLVGRMEIDSAVGWGPHFSLL